MKSVKVNDIEIFQISDIDIKLLEGELLAVDAEIYRRLEWVIKNKCDQIFNRMKVGWVDSGKLAELGVTSIPTARDALVELITALPEYKNREQREAE